MLNHRHCRRWFPVLENTIVSTDPLKQKTKVPPLEVFILLFLKCKGEWVLKIQKKNTIIIITVMKQIKPY